VARLETSWGHIKEILKPEMPLDECVDTLLFLQALAEMEYSKKITAVGYMQYQGADDDFRRESRSITIFDPLQALKSKYYNMCDELLRDLFGEMCNLMTIKKETKPRQPDVASCGVMVLMFFECFIRGIEMPRKPNPALLRFMRLRYLLKCIP